MGAINHQQQNADQRMQANREELVERITRAVPSGVIQPLRDYTSVAFLRLRSGFQRARTIVV
jgi:hypothetical protein